MSMTREQARAAGETVREQVLGSEWHADLPRDLRDLVAEVMFRGIWGRPGLARPERMLCALAAIASSQRLPQLREWTGAALRLGLSPQTIQEVCLHVCYYIGLVTLDTTLAAVHAGLRDAGAEPPPVVRAAGTLADLAAAGERVKNALHAVDAHTPPASEGPVVNALFDLAAPYGYGEMWTRPGLDMRGHALVSIASFTAQRMERQVAQFARSGLKLGLTQAELIEAVVTTGPYSGFPTALQGLRVLAPLFAGEGTS